MSDSEASIVKAYELARPLYDSFSKRIKELLEDILTNSNIKYHLVESRAKDIASFKDKISRPGKRYADPLNEITDLCGCRIILYYKDEVANASSAIKSNFQVFEENLSRQADSLDADRFGYLSAHYIINIRNDRSDLVEWKRYAEMKAEVQIRTVVEHAWSAISHAIQYKQEAGIPSNLQRRLNRLAGLFEIADDEFVGIRLDKQRLISEVKQEISRGSDNISLTSASITELINSWDHKDAALEAAAHSGFTLSNDGGSDVTFIYRLAQKIGISTLNGLRSALPPPRGEYFRTLVEKSKENGSSEWIVDSSFLISLLLIAKFIDKIDVSFLEDSGIEKVIAKIILEVSQDKRQLFN